MHLEHWRKIQYYCLENSPCNCTFKSTKSAPTPLPCLPASSYCGSFVMLNLHSALLPWLLSPCTLYLLFVVSSIFLPFFDLFFLAFLVFFSQCNFQSHQSMARAFRLTTCKITIKLLMCRARVSGRGIFSNCRILPDAADL
ncbi:hypothetical protein METBIDRAFT_190779 [Metschnikowia bicuspidata var. bicuspidata NRRL YB-4993]|uniref:Uncharacterized protein n=1 Tax=Metschnikowia bicuspidata var. bicuspidata NRRL YB-4993 TaxID=869754 RepID=A0A1A0HCG9_9ASCO|nr:hypothetical protein METBIDRAFT_190779 [Metschnikowia bicuspidata var. bicuspidata NRRL YB-4993]OBA21690.1 hypothetical protein METBIDRAFT_190779 [Metschnikowia bicuspidata var. bicuspidata NRRL YB-4993]